jgi:hypothetical protein
MTVEELNVGDVFRVVGEKDLWRKANQREARQAEPPPGTRVCQWANLSTFRKKEIEVVERAPEIHRSKNTLVLRGGEVTLDFIGAWRVHRCTPGDPLTEVALVTDTFMTSTADRPTEQTALAFRVGAGHQHLGRPSGSELFAFGGRLYARATKKDVSGPRGKGGYKTIRVIDGARRVVIFGLLVLPGEFALYDIIMEHFGPDTVPRA